MVKNPRNRNAMKTPPVIKVVTWKGRECEILQDYDWTYLARVKGTTALFGITKSEVDPPAETISAQPLLFQLRNQREKPVIPENNRA